VVESGILKAMGNLEPSMAVNEVQQCMWGYALDMMFKGDFEFCYRMGGYWGIQSGATKFGPLLQSHVRSIS
jgi:hypothetical protein